jgi:hypothetical protein
VAPESDRPDRVAATPAVPVFHPPVFLGQGLATLLHELIQPLYLSVLADDVAHPVADTGLGFKTLAKIPAEATVTETTCKMERPS